MTENFLKPEGKYRGAPFWVWNTKLDKELLLRQIPIFAEMGFGGYHIHVRVGMDTDYMGEEYMDLVAACVEEGKKYGLRTFLYDEDRWPSGFAGGQVTKNAGYRMQHLLFTQVPYSGKVLQRDTNPMGNFAIGIRSENGHLAACLDVVLNEDGTLQGCRRIEPDEKAQGQKWYAYVETNPVHSWYNESTYVDVLNKEAIDAFIACTHEKYKERFREEFGKAVPSIFTDEPHMLYKTNLRSPRETRDLFLPWTGSLPERFAAEAGKEIWDCLPELFWEKENGGSSGFRYLYHKITADLFEEAYAKNIGDWCAKNHLKFTGHYLYEETLFLQNRSDGDLLRMYRHMDIPGMDLLFDEVDLTTGKQVQSIVRQFAKEGAASEEYGVTNWGFDFRGYKFQGDWQAALGITLRAPHLSMMTLEGEGKRDFPASIFYQAPWYREYKILEDHFARIRVAMEMGESRVRLGIIHPIESYWMMYGPEDQTGPVRRELDECFLNLNRWLLVSGIDFDYISEGILAEIPEGSCPLELGAASYTCVVVPNCFTLRSTTVRLLEQFAEKGGRVVNLGELPCALDGVTDGGLVRRLREFASCVPFSKYRILDALRDYREVQILLDSGDPCEDYVHQLRWKGEDAVLFLAPVTKPENRDLSVCRDLQIVLNGEFSPVLMDTMDGGQYPQNAEYMNGKTILCRKMYAYDSLLLYLKKGRAAAEEREHREQTLRWEPLFVPDFVSYTLDEDNVLLMDMAEVCLDGEPFSEREEILRVDDRLRETLHMPFRSFGMAQPYTRKKEKPSHKVLLRYEVYSETAIEEVSLALEQRKDAEIRWNHAPVRNEAAGWYLDEKIERVRLGALREGANILEVEYAFGSGTNLEAMYLLGDFGVKVTGSRAVVTERPRQLAFASLTEQNLAFYGGNVRYRMQLECPEGKLRIKASQYVGALIKVSVDGKPAGNIIFPPYELEIPIQEKGLHELELCVYGNRYNTLSHLHCADSTKVCNSFPSMWRAKGENWTYGYCVNSFGILKKPEIFIGYADHVDMNRWS